MLMKKNIPNLIMTHIVSNIATIILLIIIIALLLFSAARQQKLGSDPYAALENSLKSSELAEFSSEKPRISYINEDILNKTKESNLTLFKDAKPGQLFLEFNEVAAVYDAKESKVVAKTWLNFMSEETYSKLKAHKEISSRQNVTPQMNIINDDMIPALKQVNQNFTSNNSGMFIVAYQDKVYIYDRQNDAFALIFDTPAQNPQQSAQQLQQPQSQQPAPQQGQIPTSQQQAQVPTTQQQAQQQDSISFDTNIPADFFTKILKHPEMSGLQNVSPIGGMVTQQAFVQLTNSYPSIANKTQIGDYLLQYQDKIIIYDYQNDRIKAVLK